MSTAEQDITPTLENGSPPLSEDSAIRLKTIGRSKFQCLPVADALKIKRILNLPMTKPFPRCCGKSLFRVSRMMKEGDDTHRGENHLCEKCRCKRPAGYGTKGDFYGLGEHTGHYGVGYCYSHEKRITKAQAETLARQHMEAVQVVGDHQTDGKIFERRAEQEAVEVRKYNDLQRGLDLVLDQLRKFEQLTKSDSPTKLMEYVDGRMVEASDVTKMKLAMQLAKTFAGIKVSDFRMSADSHLHIDELILRIPKMMSFGKRMFAKLRELLAQYKQGDRDPLEQIEEEWRNGMKDIWADARTAGTKGRNEYAEQTWNGKAQ